MAERRIPDIVRKARCRHDVANITWPQAIWQKISSLQILANDRSERATNGRRFHAVSKPRVHMIVLGYWEHLGLVMKAPKSRGEQNSIVVALKGITCISLLSAPPEPTYRSLLL